jgi:hypothetical protein
MIAPTLYIRQPVAPACAALLHRTAELQLSVAEKANKTTAPVTFLARSVQPSFDIPCEYDYYRKKNIINSHLTKNSPFTTIIDCTFVCHPPKAVPGR